MIFCALRRPVYSVRSPAAVNGTYYMRSLAAIFCALWLLSILCAAWLMSTASTYSVCTTDSCVVTSQRSGCALCYSIFSMHSPAPAAVFAVHWRKGGKEAWIFSCSYAKKPLLQHICASNKNFMKMRMWHLWAVMKVMLEICSLVHYQVSYSTYEYWPRMKGKDMNRAIYKLKKRGQINRGATQKL